MSSTVYKGVTFTTVRAVLFNMYLYRPGMSDEDAEALYNKYVLPMQHNFENPLEGDQAKDTFIEYWIQEDDRITNDANNGMEAGGKNEALKLATIDVRFLGVRAEVWAKAFHHISRRPRVGFLFDEYCQGQALEYIGAIRPIIVDYFGVGNSAIAFDLTIRVQYRESIDLAWLPLEYISFSQGDMKIEGGLEQED